MLRTILSVLICLTAALLLSQCSDSADEALDGYGTEYPHTRESFVIIDSAMDFMQTDPALSHRIIDSVCQAKLMSPQRCDYYHAIVVDTGEEKSDSALTICDRLLDEGKFGDDEFLEEEICVLASNIALSICRYHKTLEYVNRGVAICHGQKQKSSDEAILLGRAGQAEQMLGRTEEAKHCYAEATKLLKDDKTFAGLVAGISIMKKQSSLYSSTQEYDKAIALYQEVLHLVEAFHRDPSSVEMRPDPMAVSGEATLRFADFYQCQMYSRIAKAYHKKIEQEGPQATAAYLDSVNLYLDRWEQTQSHHTPLSLANAIHLLFYTGRKAAFEEAKTAVGSLYQGDSIVSDYVEYLTLLAAEADARHDIQASCGYMQRALAISESIRQQEMLQALSEQMSIHMVQQQQLARQKAENEASTYRLIIVMIITVLVASLLIIILHRIYRKNKKMLQKTQQELIEAKEEVNDMILQFEEAKEEKLTKDIQERYDRILETLEQKKLYLNPDLNMTMLAEEMCTNRTFISTCINTITGKSFRTWLAEYRLNIFLKKQKENPDMPIDQLLIQCGYNERSTFQRQFKATFGTTPTKYKDNCCDVSEGE